MYIWREYLRIKVKYSRQNSECVSGMSRNGRETNVTLDMMFREASVR